MVIHVAVELEFVFIQGDLGKQAVLVDQEIGDARAGKQVLLLDLAQLVGALEQEEQFCLQGVTGRVLVEAGQEGVVFRLFQQQVIAERHGQPSGQAGLAGTDGAFHGNKARQGARLAALFYPFGQCLVSQ